jgi:hypothetical protein
MLGLPPHLLQDEHILPIGPYTVGSEQFFLEVVLRELVAIGQDSALVHTHDRVLRAMGFIALTSGTKIRFALPSVRFYNNYDAP